MRHLKAAAKSLYIFLGGFGIALLAGPSSTWAQTDDGSALPSLLGGEERIVVGGGLPFGLYFPTAGALCRALPEPDMAGCAVAPLSDSAAAIRAVRDGKVDMAIVQSDWLHHAVNGTSRYSDAGPSDDLVSIAAFHGEAFIFATRSATPPLIIDDLEGRRVEVGAENSYRGLLGRVALNAAGIDEDDLAILGVDPLPAAMAALCGNRTDAVTLMAAHPAEAMAGAAGECNATPMSFDQETIDKLLRLLPGYVELTLPAGTYPGQTSPAKTVGVRAVLVTTRDADPAMVSRVARGLAGNAKRLATAHRALSGLSVQGMARASAFAPLHPAAAEAFGVSGQ